MKQYDSKLIATHEAAHAVLAIYYRFSVNCVTIEQDKEREGYARFQSKIPTPETYWAESEEDRDHVYPDVKGLCRVLLAGGLATEKTNTSWGREGSEQDFERCLIVINCHILNNGQDISKKYQKCCEIRSLLESETLELLCLPNIWCAVQYLASILESRISLIDHEWESTQKKLKSILDS